MASVLVVEDDPASMILMDIELPGMDGVSAFKLLRQEELTKRIKVVALTSLAMMGDRERILAAGFDASIGEPIRYQTFVPELDRVPALH